MTKGDRNNLIEEIGSAEEEVFDAKKRLIELKRKMPHEEIQEYTFKDYNNADIELSSLFDDKDDLLLIHNMGKSCPYCTLWVDGFTGILKHLLNRTAFVVVSPDAPEIQREFAKSRAWNFRMVSGKRTSFLKDMGFETDDGRYLPGFSTFRKDERGDITRISHGFFGPGDDFCSVWHFFDHLAGGADGWQPQFEYNEQ